MLAYFGPSIACKRRDQTGKHSLQYEYSCLNLFVVIFISIQPEPPRNYRAANVVQSHVVALLSTYVPSVTPSIKSISIQYKNSAE